MNLFWEQGAELPVFPQLEKDIETDVLIIGGGIAGILCAYMLEEAGIDYVLAEAETIASGITKNTTAKITSQHGLIYSRLIDNFGAEKAGQYLRANEAALEKFRELCKSIDCDFETRDSFVYSLENREKLEKEVAALHSLCFPARFVERVPLPFPVVGAVQFPNQAQFNPLKFLSVISFNLKIFEHTAVRKVIGLTAFTDGGKISAKRIVVASHFPFINTHGFYFLKLYQQRSYVIALENAPELDGMYIDEAENGLSFRNYGEYLLVGGGGHRTGKKGGCWNELRSFANRYYPDSEEKFHWATQDCMSLDGVPYIGPYSSGTEGLFVASGFNKWGMTTSMASAMILCDMLSGRKNPCSEVFSPSRSIMTLQLAKNAYEAVTSLMTPTSKRCPHLGCALKWNRAEHTWDCPCHGSRFTEQGGLIDNPATGDVTFFNHKRT